MLLAHERKSKRWQKYTKNNKTATILTIIIGKNKHFCRPYRFQQDFCDLEVAFYGVSHGLDGLDGMEGLDGLEGPRLSRGIDDQGGNGRDGGEGGAATESRHRRPGRDGLSLHLLSGDLSKKVGHER